jgi:hypothetical protein
MDALSAPLRTALAWLAAAMLVVAPHAGAQAERELEIKAAFLFKFGDFVEWPEGAFGAGRPFTIGVIGAADMAAELGRVTAGRTVQGRPVVVRRIARDAVLDGLHVLFVGRAEAPNLEAILAGADGLALLIVTDAEDALAKGSMINFIAAQARVRFDIALPAAERSQLRISARLLSVARKVVS